MRGAQDELRRFAAGRSEPGGVHGGRGECGVELSRSGNEGEAMAQGRFEVAQVEGLDEASMPSHEVNPSASQKRTVRSGSFQTPLSMSANNPLAS